MGLSRALWGWLGLGFGVSDRSDELYVGTERGMHKVRTLRRREATERVDVTFLNSVSARPWDGRKKERETCELCCLM